jgi:ubiquinone biosynthesis protein
MTTRLTPRYRQIAKTLRRHGLGFVTGLAGMDRLIPFHLGALGHEVRAEPYTTPEHVRLALEQLGPTFIKLGQLLSTRPDLLHADYITELAKLQDSAPPVDIDAIRSVIREELGRDPEELFQDFDPKPIASASIGQAHAATLHDGTLVVVKVRRPGAVAQIEQDLEILQDLAIRATRHSTLARAYNLQALVEEFTDTLRAELDYLQEGHNAERFAVNFSDSTDVHIPRVFWEQTTKGVLTLERMHGIKVSDISALDAAEIDRKMLARRATAVLLKMIFEDRYYHADPHPGNLFIRSDGGIDLIDFGMVGELSEHLQEGLAGFFVSLIQEDPETLSSALLGLSLTTDQVDRDRLRGAVAGLISHYHGRTLGEIDIGRLIKDLLALLREQRLQLPRELALLFKVLLMAEGIGARLDPEFDLGAALQPYADRLVQQSLSLPVLVRRLTRSGADAGELLLHLPEQLRRILDSAATSGLVVQVRMAELESLMGRAERIGNRLLAGVLAAAFIRGIGEVVSRDRKWQPWEGSMMAAGMSVIGGLSAYLLWSARRRP